MPKDEDKPGWASFTDDGDDEAPGLRRTSSPVGVIRTPTEDEVATFGKVKRVGTIPVRTDLEVTPTDEPPKPWKMCVERGGPVYRIPEGVEVATLEEARPLMDLDHLIRTKDGLLPDTRILVRGLTGWSVATVTDNLDTPGAMSGETWYMLEWVDDFNWSVEEQVPCWICPGMANLGAIKKLELYRGEPQDDDSPGFPTVQVEEMDVPVVHPEPPQCARCGHVLDDHGPDGCEGIVDTEEGDHEPDSCSCTTFEFPPCDFIHENIDQLYGVPEMPIEELPTVCSVCGRPFTYADEVAFISFPEKN